MRKFRWSDYTAKRYFIISLCAAYMALPIMADALPGDATTFLPDMPAALAAPVAGPNYDPGMDLRRQREEAERERVRQQIEEDRKRREAGVQDKTKQTAAQTEEEVRFRLKSVTADPSEIIMQEKIQALAAVSIGREVSISELTELLQKVNDIYAKEGYVTCKAYLPPQTIENGSVHIALMEGKTGEVSLSGNRYTRESYIRNRLPLRSETVQNFNVLNDRLFRFNATNDVQLGIAVKAGKKPGTSDYEIVVREPKKGLFTLFADNSGSSSTGEWRGGIYYTDNSLTGRRDSATVGYVGAKGLNSVSLNYTTPVGRQGAKLLFDYSTSSTKLIESSMRQFDSRGHGWYLSAAYLQPLILNRTTRTEAKAGFFHQKSKTDMLGGALPWIDNSANNLYVSFSMTSYGKTSVFYHQHYFGVGRARSYHAYDETYGTSNYSLYRLNSFYQKNWKNGHTFSGRLDLQWRGTRNLPSAEQFYLGGLYSVRGYKRDFIAGDSGVSFSAEYAVPLGRKRAMSLYGFFDYGSLFGRSAYNDHVLKSVGLGLKGSISTKAYVNLAVGFPLERDLNGSRVSKTRFHFSMNAQF